MDEISLFICLVAALLYLAVGSSIADDFDIDSEIANTFITFLWPIAIFFWFPWVIIRGFWRS